MKIYQVGGAVRDKLLNLPVRDRDWLVVGATPEEMQEKGFKPVGKDFPVFLHPETHEEYALARTERKTGPGYKGFIFNTSPEVTLEEDLQRRDITINAMAEDEDGNIIDPYHGRADLEQGLLRHVSPAFVEDPLRVLRVARFAARFDFTVAEETIRLMTEISESGELSALVPERVWTELETGLNEPVPVRFFDVLRQCAALKEIFPEIDRLFGIPQPEHHHPEIDCGIHTMMVLEQACKLTDDTTVRFAALVHDLGKGTTPSDMLPKHTGHEERGVNLVKAMCKRFRIPNRFRDLAVIVARYHLDCHRVREMRPDSILKKLEAMDAFRRPERFMQFLVACEADARGRKGLENRDYPQAGYFQSMLTAAKKVDMEMLAGQDMNGETIAAEIRALRLKSIKEVMGKIQ